MLDFHSLVHSVTHSRGHGVTTFFIENTALKVSDLKEVEVKAKARIPVPLLYCWANIHARPIVANSNQVREAAKKSFFSGPATKRGGDGG